MSEQPDFVTEGHLGGYIRGGDPATLYPQLWDWLYRELNVRSVIDVGCGEGWALRHFRELGCTVTGIDGIPQDDPDILHWDYTYGEFQFKGNADLVWCCEFVEHVEEQYVPNFLETFKLGRMVVMTHATPGQPGWHHVNNQPAAYWRGALAAAGMRFSHSLTIQARSEAAKNPHPLNHFVRSGMVFHR